MTAPSAQGQPATKKLPALPTRLVGATFRDAIQFAGTTNSVSLGRNVVFIGPAALSPDGSANSILAVGDRADGLLLRRVTPTPQQAFVPWANVLELQYGLPE